MRSHSCLVLLFLKCVHESYLGFLCSTPVPAHSTRVLTSRYVKYSFPRVHFLICALNLHSRVSFLDMRTSAIIRVSVLCYTYLNSILGLLGRGCYNSPPLIKFRPRNFWSLYSILITVSSTYSHFRCATLIIHLLRP